MAISSTTNRGVRLDSIASINPDSVGRDYPYPEIKYIDISSVGSGTVAETTLYPVNEAPSRAKRLVSHGDTILSTVRPNRRSFLFIKEPDLNLVVSTGFAVLRPLEKVDPRFLYCLVTDQRFTDYLAANAKGAAYPAVDTETIARAVIPLPPLSTQRRIASILSAYDDLIENNTRRIKILEEMAQRIYREWFVHFRFPGHEGAKMKGGVPEGWERKRLGEIATLSRGRSYRTPDLVDEGGLPFLNLKCVQRGGGFRVDGLKRYQGIFKETQTAKAGDIVVAVTDMTQEKRLVAHAARVPHMREDKFVLSMDLVKIESVGDAPNEYLYAMFRFSGFSDEVKQHANGANVLHLNPERITAFELAVPPRNLMENYAELASGIFEQCDILQMKNDNLRRTRDLLLPKLVSGEVAVNG